MKNKKKGILFVVSGPSGTGKSTLCRALLKTLPPLRFSVSHTTRPRRPGEREGRDYCFVSPAEFQRMIDRGDFVEWAEIYRNRYGTSKRTLRRARREGQDLILDIDVQGVRQLRKQKIPGVFVFILPPSLRELKRRLSKRNTEGKAALDRRLKKAQAEITQARMYDYLVINDDLIKACKKLKAVFLAEHCRQERLTEAIEKLLVEK
ncbi:MAG: guanylate kinase [Planctomycetaceae bacterium]